MENELVDATGLYAHAKVIRKNAAWLFIGQIVGRLFRTIIIIYSARILLKESWGAFNYALSIATFLTVLSDIGISAFLIREANKNPERKREYISTSLFIKVALLIVLAVSFIFLAGSLFRNSDLKALLPIVVFIFVFDSLRDFGLAIARLQEKMENEGINNILTNFFIFGFGFLFLYLNSAPFSIGLAYAAGTGLGLISIAIAVRDDIKEILKHFNRKLIGYIISSAWPFSLVGLMGIIMLNTDVFLIGSILSLKEVALYSAPQKLIQLLYMIPTLISTAFFPAFSKYVKDEHKFRRIFEAGLSVIFMIAIPIAFGSIILAGPIISLIYGEGFSDSTTTFIILSATILIFSPAILIGSAIFAHDRPRVYMTYALIGIIGNLVLDVILIPIFGIEGSAAATLITQVVINTYAIYQFKKIMVFEIFGKIRKFLAASAVMIVAALVLEYSGVNVAANIAASGLVYFGILVLLKEKAINLLLGKSLS